MTVQAAKPTIILVRHGESITNVHRAMHLRISDPEVWLTEKGKGQAEAAAISLAHGLAKGTYGFTPRRLRIMHSEYRRARQTSSYFEEHLPQALPHIFVDSKEEHRLRELEFGYTGAVRHFGADVRYADHVANLLRFQGHKFLAPRFGGEAPSDVDTRIRFVLSAIYRDMQENGIDTFVLVTHGLTMRVIIRAIMAETNAWYEKEANPDNCAIRLIHGGKDRGFIFPNPNGQWNPDWQGEEEEDAASLNPDGLFFTPAEIEHLIRLQAHDPAVTGRLAAYLQANRNARATDAIEAVVPKYEGII